MLKHAILCLLSNLDLDLGLNKQRMLNKITDMLQCDMTTDLASDAARARSNLILSPALLR